MQFLKLFFLYLSLFCLFLYSFILLDYLCREVDLRQACSPLDSHSDSPHRGLRTSLSTHDYQKDTRSDLELKSQSIVFFL